MMSLDRKRKGEIADAVAGFPDLYQGIIRELLIDHMDLKDKYHGLRLAANDLCEAKTQFEFKLRRRECRKKL